MKWKLGGLINLLILIKDLNKDSNGNSDEREYHGNKSRIQFNLPNPSPLLPPLKTSGQWNLTYLISYNVHMISVWYMELCPFVKVFNTEWSFLAWTVSRLTILF